MMKRRKTSRRPLEPRFAPTYTENGSFMAAPINQQSQPYTELTLKDIVANMMNTTTLSTASIPWSAIKISYFIVSLASGSSKAVINFNDDLSHTLTDTLKASKIKGSKFNPLYLWVPIPHGTTVATLPHVVYATVPSGQTSAIFDYIGVSVRYRLA
jgi:hypothetical protein